MEILLVIVVLIVFGFWVNLSCNNINAKTKHHKPVNEYAKSIAEQKEKDFEKLIKDAKDAAEAKLQQRFDADKERWAVQVTDKKGAIHRTDAFVPRFYVNIGTDYSNLCIRFAHEYYHDSKSLAQDFVATHSYKDGNFLVQIGNKYLCRSSIAEVELINVTEEK